MTYYYKGGEDVRVGDRYEVPGGNQGTVIERELGPKPLNAYSRDGQEITAAEFFAACTLLRRAEEKPSETRHDFREGDRVRMISGTFAGATGVVTRDTGDTHCVPVKLDHEDFYPRRMPPENVERITDEKAERAETGWCESCQDSAAKCECGLVAENEYAGILESLSRALARPTRAQRYQLFRRAVTSAVSKQPTMRAVTDYVSGNFVAWITAPLAGEKRFLVPEGRDVNYLTLAEQWVWDMAELVRVVAGARVLGKREKDSERDQRIADAHARWLA